MLTGTLPSSHEEARHLVHCAQGHELVPERLQVHKVPGRLQVTKSAEGTPKAAEKTARSSRHLHDGLRTNSSTNDSAERQWLTSALEQARRAAQDRPAAQQVEECQAFIQRSKPIAPDGAGTDRRAEGARRSSDAVNQIARRNQQSCRRTHAARCDASSARSHIDRVPPVASACRRDGGREGSSARCEGDLCLSLLRIWSGRQSRVLRCSSLEPQTDQV